MKKSPHQLRKKSDDKLRIDFHEPKPRWRDLLTWDLLLSDFIQFLSFKSHFCDSLTDPMICWTSFVPDLRISENSVVGK